MQWRISTHGTSQIYRKELKKNLNFYARSASINFSKKFQAPQFHKTTVVRCYLFICYDSFSNLNCNSFLIVHYFSNPVVFLVIFIFISKIRNYITLELKNEILDSSFFSLYSLISFLFWDG